MDLKQSHDDQIVQNQAQDQVQEATVQHTGKESEPVGIGTAEQNLQKEYATHKDPEISPEVKSAGVKKVTPPKIDQKQVDEVLTGIGPTDPANIQKSDIKRAERVEKKGDIRDGVTWLATILEFIDKKILRRQTREKST